MAIIDAPVWRQNGKKIFAYKYPNVNLSSKTQLNVGMSQEALLFINGELKGKYASGKYTLDTANIPVLRKLFGLPFGGQNPFMAEVWYINKADLLHITTTTEMFMVRDSRYPNGLPLVAQVNYGLKVAESEPFLLKLVNEESPLYDYSIEDRFGGRFIREVSAKIASLADLGGLDLPTLNAQRTRISDELRRILTPFIETYGLTFIDFNVDDITIDTSDKAKQMTSGFGFDPHTYQQARMLDIQEKAMENMSNGDGGMLGAIFAMSMMNNGSTSAPPPSSIHPQQPQAPSAPPAKPVEANNFHNVYCSNCGKKYASNVNFCPFCGDEYWACSKCGADNDRKNKRCVSCGILLIGEEQAQCPNCNATCSADAQFCPSCGRPMKTEDTCKQCGAKLEGAKFCPQCGAQHKF